MNSTYPLFLIISTRRAAETIRKTQKHDLRIRIIVAFSRSISSGFTKNTVILSREFLPELINITAKSKANMKGIKKSITIILSFILLFDGSVNCTIWRLLIFLLQVGKILNIKDEHMMTSKGAAL
jgi:hypothetical protein